MDFNYIMDDGWVRECACCASPAPLANFPEPPKREDRLLCEICANTEIGRVIGRQTANVPEYQHHQTLKCIAQTANTMLDMILKRSPSSTAEGGIPVLRIEGLDE